MPTSQPTRDQLLIRLAGGTALDFATSALVGDYSKEEFVKAYQQQCQTVADVWDTLSNAMNGDSGAISTIASRLQVSESEVQGQIEEIQFQKMIHDLGA